MIYIVPICFGVCVTLLIAVSSKHLRAKWFLFAYLATLVFTMTVSAAPKLGQPVPEALLHLVAALELTYGPWFYLYSVALTSGEGGFKKWYGLLFVPAVFGLFVTPGFFSEIQNVIYVGLILRNLYRAALAESATPKRALRSKVVIAGAGAALAFLLLTFVLAIVQHFLKFFPEGAAYPATIGAFLAIAGFHLRFPDAYYDHWPLGAERSVDEQTRKLGLSAEDLDNLMQSVQVYLKEHHPQRDPELNITGLAEQLGLAPAQLSFLVNNRIQKRFTDFINELRASEARDLLTAGSQSVTEVMLAVGFRSKSTFYKYFKSLTGTTPTDFIKSKSSSA